MSDRIFLILPTTTYRASAFLKAARKLDIEVVVGSDRRQALADQTPGKSLAFDFQNPETAVRKIVQFFKADPPKSVLGVDDDSVLLAAMASEALSLPHNTVASVQATRNKHRMRSITKKAGIPSPGFSLFPIDYDPVSISRSVKFPCVLKPLSLSTSRGVIRANNPDEFESAFKRIAKILSGKKMIVKDGQTDDGLLVEDYIPGAEIALEGMLSRDGLRVLALFDKPDPLEGPFFEETLYITPSRLAVSLQDKIKDRTAEAAKALGLRDGPIHAELRLNDAGVWIVEIAARSIGGLCSRTLRFGTGMSLEEVILRHATGSTVASIERDSAAAGVMMMPIPRKGLLRAVRGLEAARMVPDIEEISITIPTNQVVEPLPEGSRYLGFIFARGESPSRVEEALRESYGRIEVIIE